MLNRAHVESPLAGAEFHGQANGAAASPSGMDWKSMVLLFIKAALRVLADELDPANRRRGPYEDTPEPKQAPTPPPPPPPTEARAPQAAPQSAESAGWGVRTEPQPVPVLRIETDTGSTVSPLSVIGDRAYVAPRAQRERQAGESRRARRKTEPMPAMLPRTPRNAGLHGTDACAGQRRRPGGARAVRRPRWCPSSPPRHCGDAGPEIRGRSPS
jgi:hypothetical protein